MAELDSFQYDRQTSHLKLDAVDAEAL